MASGWEVYYIVFLSAIVALALPILLRLVSLLITPKASKKAETAISVRKAKSVPITRINTRIFLGVNVAIVLLALTFILIPVIASVAEIRNSDGPEQILLALFVIISLTVLISLGLFYSSRKGDLGWLSTFQREDQE